MIGWHHSIHFRHLPHKVDGLPVLFASSVIRRVAVTFLGLFSPLYILQIAQDNGFALRTAIAIVLAYFLVLYLFKLLIYPMAENLGIRYGFKGVILLSGIPVLLFIPVLVWSSSYFFLLLPAAVLWGLHSGLFWWGYHGFFIKSGKAIAFGEELGVVTILETLAMAASPVVGALIINSFGFNSLFWVAGLIFLFSLALLMPASAHKPRIDITLKDALKVIGEHKRDALAYFGNAAESVFYVTLWPIFLFLVLKSTLEVGGVVSLSVLVAAVLTFLTGVWVDRNGVRDAVSLGSPMLAISWLIRAFSSAPSVFVLADGLWRFSEGMVGLSLNVISYKKALEGATDMALMFRELTFSFGYILVVFLLLVWVLAGLPLALTFIGAALFSLLPILAVKSNSNG